MVIGALGHSTQCNFEPLAGDDQTRVAIAELQDHTGGGGRRSGEKISDERRLAQRVPQRTRTINPTLDMPCLGGGTLTVPPMTDRTTLAELMTTGLDYLNGFSRSATVDGTKLTTGHVGSYTDEPPLDVVAVRGPDDPSATVYVNNCAD